MSNKNIHKKIYVAGHNGMVGSACVRNLINNGYKNILTVTSKDLDLRNQIEVSKFISKEKPDIIIDAAAKVGGIHANNNYPYEFLLENMQIQNNLIMSAHENNIPQLIFLGSSCIYPRDSKQPIKEEFLLTDSLEETNQWYAIAKISGVKLIEALRKEYQRNYISLMPTNMYGPNDNFNETSSHVLPAMIRKFHDAKLFKKKYVELWGSGTPLREFLHVDDFAKSIEFLIGKDTTDTIINVGSNEEISIKNLAILIKNIINYDGEIIWNTNQPDGTPRKLLDSSRINKLGWKSEIKLKNGINDTYKWFVENYELAKK